MPVVSLSYEFASRRFSHRLCLDYGRSSYIKVNDSRRWGKNNFSILGFQYDLLWRKKRRKENPVFFWGLGVSLENRRISQKTEMSPGSYNTYEDHYFGIGPTLSLLCKLGRAEFGLDLGSSVSIPHASYSVFRSDVAFTDKCDLYWVKIGATLRYHRRIRRDYAVSIEFSRDSVAYGTNSARKPSCRRSTIGVAHSCLGRCGSPSNITFDFYELNEFDQSQEAGLSVHGDRVPGVDPRL